MEEWDFLFFCFSDRRIKKPQRTQRAQRKDVEKRLNYGFNLSGANMVGANWEEAWLLDAILWNTICPDGDVVIECRSIGSY